MPMTNATEESNMNFLSLRFIPYVNPIVPHKGIPTGKAKKPIVRKQTSMMMPIAVNILFLKLFMIYKLFVLSIYDKRYGMIPLTEPVKRTG